jgi:hypothetical protein
LFSWRFLFSIGRDESEPAFFRVMPFDTSGKTPAFFDDGVVRKRG